MPNHAVYEVTTMATTRIIRILYAQRSQMRKCGAWHSWQQADLHTRQTCDASLCG